MVSAQAWFNDCTYLHSKSDVERIFNECWDQGFTAHIDWSAPRNAWIFHTLSDSKSGLVSKKRIAKEFEQPRGSIEGLERWLEDRLCMLFETHCVPYARQLRCECGIIDVVTAQSIIEIKYKLSRGSFFSAIGQVLSYRAAHGGEKFPIILSKSIDDDARIIAVHAKELAIQVIIWDGISAMGLEHL